MENRTIKLILMGSILAFFLLMGSISISYGCNDISCPNRIKKSAIVINSTRDETELNINCTISDGPFRINSTVDIYIKENGVCGYDSTFLKSLLYLAIVLFIISINLDNDRANFIVLLDLFI